MLDNYDYFLTKDQFYDFYISSVINQNVELNHIFESVNNIDLKSNNYYQLFPSIKKINEKEL